MNYFWGVLEPYVRKAFTVGSVPHVVTSTRYTACRIILVRLQEAVKVVRFIDY